MKKMNLLKVFMFLMFGCIILTACKKSSDNGTTTNPNDPGNVENQ